MINSSLQPRLRAHYVHQIMIAASVIAAMQISALLSYRVWARLQSLSLANMFSTLWRCLYCVLQKGAGELRRFVASHSVKPRDRSTLNSPRSVRQVRSPILS